MAEVADEIIKAGDLEQLGIKHKVIKNGQMVMTVYQGPWIDTWYDNYTECLRENQNKHRIDVLKKQGLNDQAQTKEQEQNLKKRVLAASEKKKRAEMALIAASENS